ncbi:tRNA (adenosine(37)-N6)-dimethylallyltransferase MiaA [Prochlorococcus marinus]|uniref:tRNA dimethylallyltransferase n=1 Tax=Prochlorococcus marinus XMU1408 TaxID=2213228 RepID=A0A318QWT0_PROMR|nr:tRNA (adenosine(37)-N6)-dimethylallyltransferase MiaA [Prochlorococcus marinus]MBW3042863.1 tRNA (adenosine(37)-N6)-dimethylallyltransferase MiaA [Prochlorococcus marinus str. XMU1408]PYE00689.1 tRNA (adenosine(37)-N6)-dimethylallyltransferase MiaA [Prochlorococcus marinus XMU1408]
MQPNKPLVIALMGPTASGKTELGIEIADKINTEIHNVDSRQVYIDMNIGTAKPTLEQQKQVHHFLIDLCLPSKPINIHDFQLIASTSIKKELKKRKIILLVGGSGLYLQALVRGLTPPPVSPQKFLRDQLIKMEKNERHNLLKTCDPNAAKKIHPADSTRTIRALEVFYATGKMFSQQKNFTAPPWSVLELGLNPGNLISRIKHRTEKMYKNGLIEETENLINKYGNDLQLLKTIGYGEATSIINGKINSEEALEITIKRTCQFAKRQKTWFRNKHNSKWLNYENALSEALSCIYEVLG